MLNKRKHDLFYGLQLVLAGLTCSINCQVPTGHNLSAERVNALWRDADREGEGELNLEALLGLSTA